MDRAFSIEDALVYLDKIKCAYGHRPEVYGKFLAIMKEFKMQIIKTDQVIQKISGLFADNEHLIVEFTNFLPFEAGTASHTSSVEVQQLLAPTKIQQAHAMQYVIKVRNRFIHYPLVYSRFLDILQVYHSGRQNISEVLEHVAKLLADQEDLLSEFVYFLPEALQEQAKTRMDQALQECASRRQLREQQDPTNYHYSLPCPTSLHLINQSAPDLNAQSLSKWPESSRVVTQVEKGNIDNPLPRTSVAMSVSSGINSHGSSSSLSSDSGLGSVDFEVIPQDEAYGSAAKPELCMHSALPTQPTQTAQAGLLCAQSTNSTDPIPLTGTTSTKLDQAVPPSQRPILSALSKQPLHRLIQSTQPTQSTHPTQPIQPIQPIQPTQHTEQLSPRASRPVATCFHTPEAPCAPPVVGSKRKKNVVENTAGASYNTRGRGAGQQNAPAVTSTSRKASSAPQEGNSRINMEQLIARNVQMSVAMADLDRRLGTVECLVDLQRKRVEDHKAEIVALKVRLSRLEKGKK